MDNRPLVYWILQDNHLTPTILDFLKFFVQRVPNLNLQFMVPNMWKETQEKAAPLNPVGFDGMIHHDESYDWVCRKRDSLQGVEFQDGLEAWRVLLLDDLNAGTVHPVIPKLPENPNLKFIILQLPIPLGSTENEERMFYACVHWAHQHQIPVIGYELLPFDTKWTLIQALVDGVITTNERSYDWLTSEQAAIPGRVWCLPRYEGQLFNGMMSPFWQRGIGVPHQFIHQLDLKDQRLNLYIPHNVAMSYEFKKLIHALAQSPHDLHLMISVGKDQGRGTHTHQEIVETLSREDLARVGSFSFHDVQNALDMTLADAVVSCASCYATFMAGGNGIPSLVVDADVTPGQNGHITIVPDEKGLNAFLDQVAASHKKTARLETIFTEILAALP